MSKIINGLMVCSLASMASCASAIPLYGTNLDGRQITLDKEKFESYEFQGFPKSSSQRILAILKSGSSPKAPKEIRDVICKQSKPLVNFTYKVNVMPPKSKKGTPLNIAADQRKEFSSNLSGYFKSRFLQNASTIAAKDITFGSCTNGINCKPCERGIAFSGRYNYFVIGGCTFETAPADADEYTTTLYPVFLAHAVDLAVLQAVFTFMTPDASQLLRGYVDSSRSSDDVINGQLTPASAIRYKEQMWAQYLSEPALKEAAQPDGSISYELTLDMSLFCQYGMPLSDLVSQ